MMSLINFLLPLGLVAVRILLIKFLPETDVSEYGKNEIPHPTSFFDFIVVGSGSAGAVVAARLTENPSWNVLLLEAGGLPTPETYVPGLDILLYLNEEANWGYKTVPQKHSMFGYAGRSNLYSRGRALGGSSSINYMMYVRGNKRDFDSWADMGNPGWDYESVLPYFKKSQDHGGKRYYNSSRYHGYGGPLKVSPKPWGTPLQYAFLKAGIELGYPTIDPNEESQIGFSLPDMTIRNGIRESTAEAFLRPNMRRPNLRVLTGCHATKVLFDEHKRAVGVEYLNNGKKYVALARREVILSAGAVDSPKLLMLSGVGPKQHLKEHYVPLVHDLPGVGQNLQDHPVIFGLSWTVNHGALSARNLANPNELSSYFKTRRGILSHALGVEGNSWAQLSGGDPEWPDSQFLLVSFTPALDKGILLRHFIGYDRQLYDRYFAPILGKEGFCIGPIVVRPKSRGSITLRTSNPLDQANIDPNFFDHPDDLYVMVRAIKFALRIGGSKAFMYGHGARFHNKPLPGCDHLVIESDEYWACYARFMTSTVYHPTSTCKMAPAHDEMGVVDNRLRVRGVKGLRVIDASIMPIIPNGNTNAASIMVGEKGADLVIEDWINEAPDYKNPPYHYTK